MPRQRNAWLTPDEPESILIRWLFIPDTFSQLVTGALVWLADERNWEQFGDVTPALAAQAMAEMIEMSLHPSPLVGSIHAYAGDLPAGVLACDGETYPREAYPHLYDALDDVFIIDAATFKTPNLADRVIVGQGPGGDIGDTGGAATVTLTVAEMPIHTHDYIPPALNPDVEGPGVPDIGATVLGPITQTSAAGQGQPHENRPPYLVLRYGIIAW